MENAALVNSLKEINKTLKGIGRSIQNIEEKIKAEEKPKLEHGGWPEPWRCMEDDGK